MDGVYPTAGLENDEEAALLVVTGVLSDETKELLAVLRLRK